MLMLMVSGRSMWSQGEKGMDSYGSRVTVVVSVLSVRGLRVLFALQLFDIGGVGPRAGRRASFEEVRHVSDLHEHRH